MVNLWCNIPQTAQGFGITEATMATYTETLQTMGSDFKYMSLLAYKPWPE